MPRLHFFGVPEYLLTTDDHHYRPIALGLLTIIALATLAQAASGWRTARES